MLKGVFFSKLFILLFETKEFRMAEFLFNGFLYLVKNSFFVYANILRVYHLSHLLTLHNLYCFTTNTAIQPQNSCCNEFFKLKILAQS